MTRRFAFSSLGPTGLGWRFGASGLLARSTWGDSDIDVAVKHTTDSVVGWDVSRIGLRSSDDDKIADRGQLETGEWTIPVIIRALARGGKGSRDATGILVALPFGEHEPFGGTGDVGEVQGLGEHQIGTSLTGVRLEGVNSKLEQL
jgi:hypothetical protein